MARRWVTTSARCRARIKAIDTWLSETPTGLAGTYVLHEPTREVTGTLEAIGDEDCDVALFGWTDLYGTGGRAAEVLPGGALL